MMLTIAIPTYNRIDQLNKVISSLLPQINSNCRVVVIDNNSDISPLASSGFFKKNVDAGLIHYQKNKFNVGADANIIKCIELSDSDYTWVLGDDDIPDENAVKTIFQTVGDDPHSVFLNFSSDMFLRKKNINGSGLNQFIQAIDSFENMLFISASVYKTKYIQENLRHAYENCSSSMQNLSCLLSSLPDGSKFSLRKEKLVCWEPVHNGWDPLIITMRFFLILDNLKTDAKHIRMLARKIRSGSASNKAIIVNLIRKIISGQDKYRIRQMYGNYISRVYHYEFPLKLISHLYFSFLYLPIPVLKLLMSFKKNK